MKDWPKPDAANGHYYTLHADLAGWQRSMLQSKAKEWGIRGYSRMSRNALQRAILNHPNNKPKGDEA